MYLAAPVAGKVHDKKAAAAAAISYPVNATLSQDTGFQGYAPAGGWPLQPKKPRGQALNLGQCWVNWIIASVRVRIEHVIAGIKRCRIVKEELRLTRSGISDQVMAIACGLHNWRTTWRRPLPTITLS